MTNTWAGKRDGNYKVGLFAISALDNSIIVPLKANPLTGALIVQNPGGVWFGDMAGPAASTDNGIAVFFGTTGKVLRNSNVTIDAIDNVAGVASITIDNLWTTQVVLTDAGKKLISEAKWTAFNKNFGTTAWTIAEWDHTHPAGDITSGTLDDARLSANVTLAWNTFNGNSELVQLDVASKLLLGGVTSIGSSRIQIDSSIKIGDNVEVATTAGSGVLRFHAWFLEVSDGTTWHTIWYADITGLSSLNWLTATGQTFAVGSSGSDFNISSLTDVHTFNIPTASATKRGLITAADYITFSAKEDAVTRADITTSTAGINIGGTGKVLDSAITLDIAIASASETGLLSETDFIAFTNKADISHTHNASAITSGTLSDSRLSSAVTKGWNTFNTANNLVQLDWTGKLPALDWSQLTGLSFSQVDITIDQIIPSTVADQYLVTQDVLGVKTNLWINIPTPGITNGTVTPPTWSSVVYDDGNERITVTSPDNIVVYEETQIITKDKDGRIITITSATGTYNAGTHIMTYTDNTTVDWVTGNQTVENANIAYLDKDNTFTGNNLYTGTQIFGGTAVCPLNLVTTTGTNPITATFDWATGNNKKLSTSGAGVVYNLNYTNLASGWEYLIFINNTANNTINFSCTLVDWTSMSLNAADGAKPLVSTTGTYFLVMIVWETACHFAKAVSTSVFTN